MRIWVTNPRSPTLPCCHVEVDINGILAKDDGLGS